LRRSVVVVGGSADSGRVYVAISKFDGPNVNGGFGSGGNWTWNSETRKIADDAKSVFLSDVNGDEKSDLVVVGGAADRGRVYVAISKFDGPKVNGGFGPGGNWTWNSGTRKISNDAEKIILSDVNGDRKSDLAVVGGPDDFDSGIVYIAISKFDGPNVNGGFGSGGNWTWNSGTRKIADDAKSVFLSDVNGDEKSDLVVVGGAVDRGRVYVAISKFDGPNVNGGFGLGGNWTWNSGTRKISNDVEKIILSDVNGDRKSDLAVVGGPDDFDSGIVYFAISKFDGPDERQ